MDIIGGRGKLRPGERSSALSMAAREIWSASSGVISLFWSTFKERCLLYIKACNEIKEIKGTFMNFFFMLLTTGGTTQLFSADISTRNMVWREINNSSSIDQLEEHRSFQGGSKYDNESKHGGQWASPTSSPEMDLCFCSKTTEWGVYVTWWLIATAYKTLIMPLSQVSKKNTLLYFNT